MVVSCSSSLVFQGYKTYPLYRQFLANSLEEELIIEIKVMPINIRLLDKEYGHLPTWAFPLKVADVGVEPTSPPLQEASQGPQILAPEELYGCLPHFSNLQVSPTGLEPAL